MYSFVALAFLLSSFALASVSTPDCIDGGAPLAVNNDTILNWKQTTANQFKARGHILGSLQKIYPDHTGHTHFEVKIGAGNKDTIEVIYNEEFGRMPDLVIGMKVEACGDYITSNKPGRSYPASPDGAILHWVHKAMGGSHPGGYVTLNGVVYGQQDANH